jgi:hypothetical protein
MLLSLFIFGLICLVLIHFVYQWLQSLVETQRKTRDLVKTQTDKYKQMLDKVLLDKHLDKAGPLGNVGPLGKAEPFGNSGSLEPFGNAGPLSNIIDPLGLPKLQESPDYNNDDELAEDLLVFSHKLASE